MSDIVKEIREGIEGIITTTLPTWKKLDFKFDLTKNNANNSSLRFGVKSLEGPSGISILKNYTVNRTFEISFMNDHVVTQDNDTNIQTSIDIIESAIDEVLVAIVSSKAGVADKVLLVDLLSIEAPDFSIQSVTFINLTLNISYKRLLS